MEKLVIDPQTLNFCLPDELIAQTPPVKRDHARMMVVNRASKSVAHQYFYDVVDFLNPSDVLVINTAKVSPAKVVGTKITGGRVEAILLGPSVQQKTWRALLRPLMKPGSRFHLGEKAFVELVNRTEEGENILQFLEGDPETLIREQGVLPLPPYIKRAPGKNNVDDAANYQTVYAAQEGSIAAPTAGLHFTPALLDEIKAKGILVLNILLNVGWGTFRPISKSIKDHRMLGESFSIQKPVLSQLYEARKLNRRIVAVGTTVTRTLESLPEVEPGSDYEGQTDIFIQPGFSFRWVQSLITNFHVPRSTPVSLVGAFMGLSLVEMSYSEAVANRYRFFSYGDAMFIL